MTAAEAAPAQRWEEAVARGRFDEAERLYIIQEEGDPDVRQALAGLADLLSAMREKAWARVRKRLERLEELPELLDQEALRAEVELLEGFSRRLDRTDPDELLGELEAARVHWFRAEMANQVGTVHIYAGRFEAARNGFEEALEHDPRHYRALTNLGNALLEEGEVDEAIDCYQRALALNEEFANAHHNLGVAYRRKGEVGKSVRHLRRAQRVQQRTEREQAREQVGRSGQAGMKALRWVLWGVTALVIFMILRNQGLI